MSIKPLKIRYGYRIIAGVILISGVFWLHKVADAATFTWDQSSWSGGLDGGTNPVHPTNETGWTQYSALDASSTTISGGAVTASFQTGSSAQTTDTDFNGGTFASTTVFGSSTAGSVILNTPTQSATNTWATLTSVPQAMSSGGNATVGANGFVYVFPGNGTQNNNAFLRYSVSGNSWATMAGAPSAPGNGAALAYPGSGNFIYAIAGNSTNVFMRYSISANTWSTMTAAPGILYTGSTLLATGGDFLYALAGTNSFYRYSISGNSWVSEASLGSTQYNSMAYPGSGNFIYATDGAGDKTLWRYTISGNGWGSVAAAPTAFNAGASLISPGSGDYIYALAGSTDASGKVFMRYSISNNSWATVASITTAPYEGDQLSYPTTGNFFYDAPGNNSTGFYKYNFTTVYAATGTFVSAPIDLGQISVPTTFSFNQTATSGQSIKFQLRAAQTSGGLSSAAWFGPTGTSDFYTATSGTAINAALNDNRYFQYEMYASTTNTILTPSFLDETINYQYYPATTTLTSSVYNSSSLANILAKIQWTATTTASTSVKFQFASAPDVAGAPGAFTSFVGPDGTSNTYFSSSTGGDSFPAILATSSQWFRYKAYLISTDGSVAPASLSEVKVNYVVNAPPQLATTTFSVSESATGTVSLAYSVLDPDTNSGTITPGFVTPSFQYSLNGGVTWTNILASTTSSGAMSNKAVSTSTYSNYTAAWFPAQQIPNSYSTQAEIKMIMNDNEAANNIVSATSSNFTLDTTPPAPGGVPITVDESQTSPLITLNATDNSTFYMKVGKRSDLSDAPSYVPYNSTTTLALTIGDNIYAQFQDMYGNATGILSLVPPETPSNIFYEDTSNPQTSDWRIFFAWGVIDNPNAGFRQYNIYRSVNSGGYALLATSSNRTLNYIVDAGLSSSNNYSYELTSQDSNGNVSFYSSSISHTPSGTGGSDLSVPVLSNITVTNITSTGATINWTSNKYSNSSVYYAATSTYPGSQTNSYTTSSGVPAVVESHSVTLSNLTPGTQYYFMTQSTDPSNNIGSSASASYNFTTTSGPVISNTTASTIYDNSATITWNTDSPSNSTVYYSTSPAMTSPATLGSGTLTSTHSVSLTGLQTGMKYYYYVTSADSHGNTAVDNDVINGVVNYYSFNTTNDVNPPAISAVAVGNVGVTGATVTWNTDKNATSRVTFGLNSNLSGASTTAETNTYSTTHAVILSGLSPGTTYYYSVFSTDVNGNATSSPNDGSSYSFTTVTASSYVTPPVLSNISVASVTPSTANISWTTSSSSDSSVFYIATLSYPGGDRGSYQSSVGVPALVTSHTVSLMGLIPSTTYYFFVQSTDSSNNIGTSTDSSYNFTTTAGPVISSTTASSIQDNSAVVTWNTNVLAGSQVYYSTNSDLSNPQTLGSGSLTTSHSVSLTGLTNGTTYYYYVTSTDNSGNKATDNNVVNGVVTYYSFTTVSDNTAPLISNATTTLVGINGATIVWTTDKNANSQVTYDTDPAFATATSTALTSSFVINHSVTLPDLQPGTTYYYYLYSADQNGNHTTSTSSTGVQYTFTTASPGTTTVQTVYGGGGGGGSFASGDTTPPAISNISVTQTGQSSVTISFTTSEIANGVVNYGADATYGSEAGDPTIYQLNHTVTLTNLTPLASYHFSVQSSDVASNVANSSDATFTLVNYADTTANTNLYSNSNPAATSTTAAAALTQAQQALLSQIQNVSVTMAQAILNALAANPSLSAIPQDQFEQAIQNMTSRIVSAPVISGSTIVVTPGANSAEIAWTTDKSSNSLISYAETGDYNPSAKNPYTISAGNPNDDVTTHDITLPNLKPDTTYHYEVSSQGSLGPAATSIDRTFKTGSALPQVFNTTFTDIGENSATINWNTDVPTKTKITLKNTQTGVSTSTTESAFNTDHTYSFNNLAFSTAYTISLAATNASSTTSQPLVVPFSTVLSTAAPLISNVRVTTSLIPGNVETAQTIVSWKTDKPSTSRIFFGQGSNSDLTASTPIDTSLVTDHVVITTLLAPGTVYKIKAESGDSSDNVTDSSPYTVLTPAPAGSIVDLIITNLQGTFGVFAK